MIDKVFVDSNILVCAHDADAGPKQQRAAICLRDLWEARTGRLSTQVLQEFYVTVTQKIKTPISQALAREVVRSYAPWVHSLLTPATVVRASEISEAWRLSFWNGMILAAAEESQAARLLSEDLSHGAVVAGIEVVNPFV
jgi:predicted nucleic acid-binding protein